MEYVVDAFHAGGLSEVAIDTFTVSSPVDHGFTLTVHDSVETEIPVYQFWPNLVRLNSFPEGIRGPLHYGRRGGFQAFNGNEIDGSIVLVDFDGRDQYLNARMLGAQAVLFLRQWPRRGDQQPGPAQDPGRARRRPLASGYPIPMRRRYCWPPSPVASR